MEEQTQKSEPVDYERNGGEWFYHDDNQCKGHLCTVNRNIPNVMKHTSSVGSMLNSPFFVDVARFKLIVIIVVAKSGNTLTGRSNIRDTDSEFVRLSKQGGHEGTNAVSSLWIS